jgi:MraZ protein
LVFTGTYQRSLDDKLRLVLPKRVRSGLPENVRLFLTPGTDQCLEIHTDNSLRELAKRAQVSSAGSQKVKSFSRLFYARAEECDIDKQSRIRVPSSLAELAEISNEVVLIGVGFHWELWNPTHWESYLEQNRDGFDQVTQTTLDGGAMSETIETTEQVVKPK